MGTVTTVLGEVDSALLGRIMPHEHLLSLLPGRWLSGGATDDAVAVAVRALTGLRERGFGTVVDLSPYGVVGRDESGANAAALREISRRSEMHIVSGTAVYLESYAPDWARAASVEELTARLVADAVTGIGSSGVRAGVFGEQATSLGEITPFEERMLRATARAHRETGLSIMTHTTHGTMAQEQLDVLLGEGADPAGIVIGHVDTQLEVDAARRILDRGAGIAVDTVGKQSWDFFLGPQPAHRAEGEFSKRAFSRSDEGRADMVAALVAEGYGDRILLAQDLTGAELWMNPGTHGAWGYAYLDAVFLPMLAARGVSAEAVDRLCRVNPARVLEGVR
ncbi:MAG: aryldialkylphosphatase [Actinobacteria bacterium]|nr:aryldialkylphosphatase [Actinomycetota bacterium]